MTWSADRVDDQIVGQSQSVQIEDKFVVQNCK